MAEKSGRGSKDKQAAKEVSPFPVFDPAEISKISSRNLSAATRAARAWCDGAAEINQELVGFVNDRVKKDIETASAFMNSKTSEEAFHTQATFVEEALRDYADEASKVFHLAADLAKDAFTPVEQRTEQILHYVDEHAGDPPKAAD